MTDALTVEEVQALELEMLEYLDGVCKRNSIDYCLAYGSALGACRHGGFIPWDDDMDVYIPRSNMAALINAVSSDNGIFKIFVPTETKGYNHPYPKLVRTDTVIEEPKNREVPDMGVFIDLFPCDCKSSDGLLNRINQKIVNYLNKIYCQLYVRKQEGSSLRKLIRSISKTVSKIISPREAHRFNEWIAAFGSSDSYEGFLASPYDGELLIPVETVFPSVGGVFEGKEIRLPRDLEGYCRAVYGEGYMTPVKTKDAYHGVAFKRSQP